MRKGEREKKGEKEGDFPIPVHKKKGAKLEKMEGGGSKKISRLGAVRGNLLKGGKPLTRFVLKGLRGKAWGDRPTRKKNSRPLEENGGRGAVAPNGGKKVTLYGG